MSRKQALLTISPCHCRSKLSGSFQRHHSVFANLLIHPNLQVSLKSLALLLSLDKTLPDKVSHMMKICSNCVGLFYKLLHKMGKQDGKITGTRVISLDKNCWLSLIQELFSLSKGGIPFLIRPNNNFEPLPLNTENPTTGRKIQISFY